METREQLEQQLRELQARVGAQPAPIPMAMAAPQFVQPAPAPAPSWVQPMQMQPAAPMGFTGQPMTAQPKGLLIGINVPTPEGEATCFLEFGPEACANPQAVVMQLLQAGWPLKIYRNRAFGGGGGNGYGGGRGNGYGGGGYGGGFRRGGGY